MRCPLVLGVASRQDPRQVQNTLKKTINYNDAASGVAVPMANYIRRGPHHRMLG